MHPPLLKATAGRRKNERYKGCTNKKGNKGKHKYHICTDYGHHWHKCKKCCERATKQEEKDHQIISDKHCAF
ncbi:hypothetical protein PAHAL_3G456200 [Panicum hallii]|uniref:Uncharacterized protein n=1 Tax=Panicum hallii TaxID=206008 RepID=A0A2T8KLF7_9POAL|nr:hypothetical protein PAHAL_3G456200 [Panicum hallii]